MIDLDIHYYKLIFQFWVVVRHCIIYLVGIQYGKKKPLKNPQRLVSIIRPAFNIKYKNIKVNVYL